MQLPLLAASFGFADGYGVVAWSCWIPNVLVAETILYFWFRKTPILGSLQTA